DHRAGQGADAGLDEYMGGTIHADLPHLLSGLAGHGAIALHDPGGDLLVALPSSVLYNDAMVGGSRLSGGHANAFVVVHVLNGHLGAFLGDVLKARLAAALGHMYHSLLPQLMRCPGHAAAMVSVGGGEEGCLAKLPLQLFTGEVVVGHLGHVPPHLVGDVA